MDDSSSEDEDGPNRQPQEPYQHTPLHSQQAEAEVQLTMLSAAIWVVSVFLLLQPNVVLPNCNCR